MKRVRPVCGESQLVFGTKGNELSSRMGSCLVCISNTLSPAPLRAEGKRCCETIVPVVYGIKCPAYWKSFKHVKSQRIPCNCHYDFLVWNRALRPLRRFLVRPKPDSLVIWREIEALLIKNVRELPNLMLD
jgi:hypothetical protein